MSKYGLNAPKVYQCVIIDPALIQNATKFFTPGAPKFLLSGQDIDHEAMLDLRARFICDGDWDLETVKLSDVSIFARAFDRYSNNRSWQDVGEVDWLKQRIVSNGIQDGCRNHNDIERRLKGLDDLYQSIALENKLLTRRHIKKLSFREKNGIGVAIGRSGQLIWLADGAHRLAISKHLGLKTIPVTVLLVHEEAVRFGFFNQLVSKS
ncbi:hypothetical protein OAA71_02185 [Porticoccaceae bacterium]|nr:hypothetical protein [Porticoccaceae bacterium]